MPESEAFTPAHEVNLEAFNEVNIERTAQEAFAKLQQEFPWAVEISPEEQRLRQEEEANDQKARRAAVGTFEQVEQEAIPIKHSLMTFRKSFAEKVDALPYEIKRYFADLLYSYTRSIMELKGYNEVKVLWERAQTADAFWLNDLVGQMGIETASKFFESEQNRYQNEKMTWDYAAIFRRRGEEAPPLKIKPYYFSPGERFHRASNNFYSTYCSVFDTGEQEGFPAGETGICGEINQSAGKAISNLGIQPTGGDRGFENFWKPQLTYLPVLTQMYREGYSRHDLAG